MKRSFKIWAVAGGPYSREELEELNMTGTGASITPGTGVGYMSPKAFGNNKRKKRKGYMGYKEV